MSAEIETHEHNEKRLKLAWQLKVIGGNLRERRKKKGVSQERLAECSGLEWRSIQRFEAGKNNILTTTMIRLLNALDCRFEDMVSGTSDPDWKEEKRRRTRKPLAK